MHRWQASLQPTNSIEFTLVKKISFMFSSPFSQFWPFFSWGIKVYVKCFWLIRSSVLSVFTDQSQIMHFFHTTWMVSSDSRFISSSRQLVNIWCAHWVAQRGCSFLNRFQSSAKDHVLPWGGMYAGSFKLMVPSALCTFLDLSFNLGWNPRGQQVNKVMTQENKEKNNNNILQRSFDQSFFL